MKKISDFYAYSKNKSTTVLNLKKKVEIDKKKNESCWFKNLYCNFEKTKKDTFEYITEKKKQWKIKFSSLKFPYFKLNNSKYGHFPWYKKLYYLIRDQIYNLLKVTDGKMEEAKIEHNVNENKTHREFYSEEKFDNKSKEIYENSNDSIFYKYSKKLKKTKTNETYFGERSQSEFIKRNMSSSVIPIKTNGSVVDENMLKDTSSMRTVHEEDFCDAKETKEIDSNIILNKDSYNFLNVANSPKFNIKNTWEKLSGFIS
ncbi:conserved Plasmodium protein, unknown function [Plasmodium gallinaceum]|uniref:Uncharacterized protein n=1 Tax=Plasmodium gallinaceum TaxID=5849 RepID=A0A1J1GXT4_PLAGA|nr:conserved Plasmodium protein, unknown function [Plasmodium gallinaceum]CRG97110.1 conserved Plasmodium protein, unknown function [Plasmodium gallinaceum]